MGKCNGWRYIVTADFSAEDKQSIEAVAADLCSRGVLVSCFLIRISSESLKGLINLHQVPIDQFALFHKFFLIC